MESLSEECLLRFFFFVFLPSSEELSTSTDAEAVVSLFSLTLLGGAETAFGSDLTSAGFTAFGAG